MFKPLLAPNKQLDLSDMNFPKLASYKIDGIRGIFKDGNFLSRSLKDIQNKQLREKMKPLMEYAKQHNLIIDGEIYSENHTFQEITTFTMTQDFEDPKSVKKHGKVLSIPSDIKFHIFDTITNGDLTQPFEERYAKSCEISGLFPLITRVVEHFRVSSVEDISSLFDKALSEGNEGLMLRNPNSKYKTGRATLNEDIIYKMKPYRTYDAVIKSVTRGTVVREDAEKEVTELGYSKTSIKKDDRVPSDLAKDFVVEYEGQDLRVSLSSLTHDERREVLANSDKYVGKMIEYKGMDIGSKDVPRHPVFVRFREDKD